MAKVEYMSPAGQDVWTPIGILDPSSITAVADDPLTTAVEPTPEMVENTLNFRIEGGMPEGSYDLRVEAHLGSPVLAEKIIEATFNKRRTFRILYTKIRYNTVPPPGDFSDAYLLLKEVFPIDFDPTQWVADNRDLQIFNLSISKVGCGTLPSQSILNRLWIRKIIYNTFRPESEDVDYIIGIMPNLALEDGIDGCSSELQRVAFVTDKPGAIRTAVAHEVGHLNGLPIPERGEEEYPGGPEGIGYPIDQGFKVPTDRIHFFNFSDPLNTVAKNHHLFFNFMGLANEQNTWVDELNVVFKNKISNAIIPVKNSP
jgi:hypothetical protein